VGRNSPNITSNPTLSNLPSLSTSFAPIYYPQVPHLSPWTTYPPHSHPCSQTSILLPRIPLHLSPLMVSTTPLSISATTPPQPCLTTPSTPPLSRAVLAPPSLSYKPVTPAPRDRGNISHDPTRDSSHDPFATCTSRDLSACDPGNLRPHDPGKITHDLSRNWSSTTSPDKTRFGCASNPLINTWQIVGTINKTRPLNNQ